MATNIGDRLRLAYNEAGYTQVTLADELKVDQSHISRMVSNKTPMHIDVIKWVVIKQGYSVDWFITGRGPRKKDKEQLKTIIEISALRTEIEVMFKMLEVTRIRLEQSDNEISALKKEVQLLKAKNISKN